MNGLTLRITGGGENKTNKSIGFSPIKIPISLYENSVLAESYKALANAASTDIQLTLVKNIVNLYRDGLNKDITKLLAVVFLQAEAKHPVKCFISRYITKNSQLEESFSNMLANEISTYISTVPTLYKQHINIVSKVAMCIENFNAGVDAVRIMEIQLATYLKDCLAFCVKLLSKSISLSPTEKNEIFNLSHLVLRLLLHIIQKASDKSLVKLIPIFCNINSSIQELVFDNDVPMDTKSVCGILYLTMHILENGPKSWIDVLNPSSNQQPLRTLLNTEASQLSLYSAIATVVSAEILQKEIVNDRPAILDLMYKILDIGERSTLESTFILSVTRTVFQMSKYLHKIADRATGLSMVDSLLMFAWSHLEHHMDSVRHLTAQMLDTVVMHCVRLDREGDYTALTKLLTALKSLDTSRKSYYVSMTCLVNELGSSRVLATWPTLVQDALKALSSQHIQASATTTLETLVEKLARTCSTEELHEAWLLVVITHVLRHTLDSIVFNILDKLLLKAVKLDEQLMDYIIQYIRESKDPSGNPKNLKCVLMLLSVASKSGVSGRLSAVPDALEWKGVISYDVLRQAAIDAVDETRILSLSLIVESPKSTEQFTAGDLEFVLFFLKYNINAQAPNFRQLTLSCMKKFMKRLQESYKVIKRQNDPDYDSNKVDNYLRFVDKFREQCFASLLPGANYSRRCVALQLLSWTHQLHMDGYTSFWKPGYVEKLLLHLEDSYEENKRLALEVLGSCPPDLLKSNTYSISIDLEDILAQASSLKPTDCVSAAYKLDLLKRRLPENIVRNEQCGATDPVTYSLVKKLLTKLQEELAVCQRSVVLAARRRPMYGVLHCIAHILDTVDPGSISSDPQWTELVSDIISSCAAASAAVASVVNNSSPEGLLPMDLSSVHVSDHGNSGGVVLDDGRQVSAQMVLLCAWRSVKEVSLLLGLISSRLTIAGEDSSEGTLSVCQLTHIGEHFTSLLAETKHRGAFEQAYVGFTKLLARLWRCRREELHSLPPTWLAELTAAIASGERTGSLCATRRSAGLPFMIQALVTTELQVQSNPRCFHSCMQTLLHVARSSPCEESRTHALNIVRALFRNAALDESVAPYVGEGFQVALQGFEGTTWAERNSSTLLLSALMVRVFGVTRTRGPGAPSARNTMTGRIFYLRYPKLYGFMLDKLQQVSGDDDAMLRPSLFPVLLLLARLYPSSLEGTVSNLKLVSFVPHVQSAGASRVLRARQLAAAAMLPLIAPRMYIPHIHSMFTMLRPTTKRNYCHGILLQLVKLLETPPRDLNANELNKLQPCVEDTLWILEQAASSSPCYLIADEYTKVLHLIAWRFPFMLREETNRKILHLLETLIFVKNTSQIIAGLDIFLANAILFNFVLLNNSIENTCELIFKGLQHSSYEVILSVLKYLLILHRSLDEEKCMFQEHLGYVAQTEILDTLKSNDLYLQLLCKVLNNKYLECQQKSLKILTLEGDTQKYIIETKIQRKLNSSESIIDHLLHFLRSEHENLTHIYLESLLNFSSSRLKESSLCVKAILDVIRVIFEYSSSENSEDTRRIVVGFIERNIHELLNFNASELSEEQRFELKATMWSTIIILLEDDEAALRQRVADAVTSQGGVTSRCGVTSRLAGACAELVRDHLEQDSDNVAMLTLLALLDFQSVVVIDDGNQECRVFDQNERYNIFLEETVWTNACADKILSCHKNTSPKVMDYMTSIVDNPVYKTSFDKLCNDNVVLFKKILMGYTIVRNDALNPKIQLFVNRLCNNDSL